MGKENYYMKARKVLGIVMAAAMAVAMISGCGASKKAEEAASKAESAVEEAASKAESAAEEAASKAESVAEEAASKAESVAEEAASKAESVAEEAASAVEEATSEATAEAAASASEEAASEEGGARAPRSGDKYTVGVSETTITNPFFTTIANECEKICGEKGWNVIIADGNGDANKQITDMEDMVTQGADIILCSSYDPQIMKETVDRFREEGVPVVAIDSGMNDDVRVLTTVQAANYDNGFLCGQWCADQMGTTPVKAAIISGEAGTKNSLDRRDGLLAGYMERALEKNGHFDLEVIFQGYCKDWSEAAATDVAGDLAALGEEFNVLFSEADVMTMAAMTVLEDAGVDLSNVLIVNAADGQKEAFELLMDENSNYGCTGSNSPTAIADIALNQVAQAWFDGADWSDFSPRTYTPAGCVTKENVEEWYNPDSLF